MKIGILTYHRSHNFGALFQAIASRCYLQSLGHEVYYINYWPDYHKAMYAPFSFWVFRKMDWNSRLYYIRKTLRQIPDSIKRQKKYNSFIDKNIKPFYSPRNIIFDVIFYGSDQIWRKQPYLNDFNPVYFAKHNIETKRNIALSASAGILPKTEEERCRFQYLLKGFDSISVREKSLKDFVESCGYKAHLTCDPVLFLTAGQWDEVFPRKKERKRGYLLFVNYIDGSFDIEAVKSFAKVEGLDYVCINGSVIQNHEIGDLNNVAPLDMFDYIRNADFVCTSSFHVLVFSILYHKQCYAAFKQNAKRAESLLEALQMEKRLLEPGQSKIERIGDIDYDSVDTKMKNIRQQSFNFIKSSLIQNKNEE